MRLAKMAADARPRTRRSVFAHSKCVRLFARRCHGELAFKGGFKSWCRSSSARLGTRPRYQTDGAPWIFCAGKDVRMCSLGHGQYDECQDAHHRPRRHHPVDGLVVGFYLLRRFPACRRWVHGNLSLRRIEPPVRVKPVPPATSKHSQREAQSLNPSMVLACKRRPAGETGRPLCVGSWPADAGHLRLHSDAAEPITPMKCASTEIKRNQRMPGLYACGPAAVQWISGAGEGWQSGRLRRS